ncbi:MAG: calcium-binding protein, partial [Okeania sp. SIO3B3]|nr:calcium-binding protein [Okeania sp. SIO3B3]
SNRYEISPLGAVPKAYIDGDLKPEITAKFQNIREQYQLKGKIMERVIAFHRTLNPHSGCYFLNAEQMKEWASKPYFLDRDTSFIGPLESAATLGIMRTFKIYKPAAADASFLEIQHFGTTFLSLIDNQIKLLQEQTPVNEKTQSEDTNQVEKEVKTKTNSEKK